MIFQRGIDLVPLIIAASGISVIPGGMTWPIHRAISAAGSRDLERLVREFGDLRFVPGEWGPESRVAEESLRAAARDGLLRDEGQGLLARWVSDDQSLVSPRRQLLGLPIESVQALRAVGARWATLSETVLKNLDTAAESWASTVAGDKSAPMLRPLAIPGRR